MTEPWRIDLGDCRELLRELPADSVDAIVTDPPYELNFMGKGWDNAGVSFEVATWRAVLRVLKPGGHLLAFGGTRTYHRIACAIEDAGFEIRDSIHWIYGSGFPKGQDVSKAIDKQAGENRKGNGTGARVTNNTLDGGVLRNRCVACGKTFFSADPCVCPKPDPVTDAAKKWAGWNTALKPAHEPIVLARKPLSEDTVAANVLKWSVGGLNIDGTRVQTHREGDQGVGGQAETRGCPVHGLRGLREEDPALEVRSAAAEVATDLRTEVPFCPDDRSAESMVEGRGLEGSTRRLSDGRSTPPVGRGPRAASEPSASGVSGAQVGHGEEDRKVSQTDRDGTPPERCERRQPDREFGTGELVGALAGTPGGSAQASEAASREPEVACCACKPAVTGRWPPNLLLTHSPDCRRVGTRQVASHNPDNKTVVGDDTTINAYGDYGKRSSVGHAIDGLETVAAFECAPGCPVAALDAQAGPLKSGAWNGVVNKARPEQVAKGAEAERSRADRDADEGGASRFFPAFEWDAELDVPFLYCAKASRRERTADSTIENRHPTVKPIALMRWLCRLITPAGGLVVDPFCGSGSTGVAAVLERLRFVGFEQEEASCETAAARLQRTCPKVQRRAMARS